MEKLYKFFRNFSKYFKFQLVKMDFCEKIARKSFPKINTTLQKYHQAVEKFSKIFLNDLNF